MNSCGKSGLSVCRGLHHGGQCEQAGDGEGVGEDGLAEKTWWILLVLGFMGYC